MSTVNVSDPNVVVPAPAAAPVVVAPIAPPVPELGPNEVYASSFSVSCCKQPECSYGRIKNSIALPKDFARFLDNNNIVLVNKELSKDVVPDIKKYVGIFLAASLIFIAILIVIYFTIGRANSTNYQTVITIIIFTSIACIVGVVIFGMATVVFMRRQSANIYENIKIKPL